MYIESVPNRASPPAILLRESFRDGGRVKKRTLANLSKLPTAAINALRRILRGERLVSPDDASPASEAYPTATSPPCSPPSASSESPPCLPEVPAATATSSSHCSSPASSTRSRSSRTDPRSLVQPSVSTPASRPPPAPTVTVTASGPHHVAASETATMDQDRTVDFAPEHTGVPPFEGTAFLSPQLIDSSDPSSVMNATYAGRGMREVFDRRVDQWATVEAYLFNVRYGWGAVEFQVNPRVRQRRRSARRGRHLRAGARAVARVPDDERPGSRDQRARRAVRRERQRELPNPHRAGPAVPRRRVPGGDPVPRGSARVARRQARERAGLEHGAGGRRRVRVDLRPRQPRPRGRGREHPAVLRSAAAVRAVGRCGPVCYISQRFRLGYTTSTGRVS